MKTPAFPNAFAAGITRPAPMGVEKFVWIHGTRTLDKAWVNHRVDNSDITVPVVSTKTGWTYCANKVRGRYEYVGLDWNTGELKERCIFPDDSRVWNALGGITTVLDNGDLLIGGAFGIKRIVADDGRRSNS